MHLPGTYIIYLFKNIFSKILFSSHFFHFAQLGKRTTFYLLIVIMKVKQFLCFILTIKFLERKAACQSMEYALDEASLTLNDVTTGVSDILTIFDNYEFELLTSLSWASISPGVNSSNILKWVTTVDGKDVGSGEVSLAARQLPSEIDTGTATVSKAGKHTVAVTLSLDDTVVYVAEDYQSYNAGVAIIPLLTIIGLALSLKMVEVSMGFGVFVVSHFFQIVILNLSKNSSAFL